MGPMVQPLNPHG